MTPTSVNLSALLTRLPAATVVWTVRERRFTDGGSVNPQQVLAPVELGALTTTAASSPAPAQRATETVPPTADGFPRSVSDSADLPQQTSTVPPAEPEPSAPSEPPAPSEP
ncbi:MAG: hypothetical protein SYR96_32345, partial [Actinomycetota bacterium]|nr:hypothetical protein [Actinomycetota bacterium]